VYAGTLAGIDRLADLTVRLQNGHLRFYLAAILMALLGLVLFSGSLPLETLQTQLLRAPTIPGPLALLKVFTIGLAVLSSLFTVFLHRDLQAILALSVSGLAVALSFALEPAPDVALVQIIVDLLATVILVLNLARLPRLQREKAHEFTFRQSRPGLLRDGLIAVGCGLIVTILVYVSLETRPHLSLVSPYYAANAKPLTGAKDIVGAILVDFRGLDTLFEIAVFAAAGLGIHMLLHYTTRGERDEGDHEIEAPTSEPIAWHQPRGVAGLPTSPLLHQLANALLPLSMLLAAIQIMYGHDQPGDGFTAGVFISLAVGFWYVVFGYHYTKAHLRWVRPGSLIGAGLLLGMANGLVSAWFGGGFLAPVDYGQMLGLPLPAGLNLGSALIFEIAICLVVLGSSTYILDNLGRPNEADPERDALLRQIEQERSIPPDGDPS
jgi:multicomponent K+:H+ antiporter subunit A